MGGEGAVSGVTVTPGNDLTPEAAATLLPRLGAALFAHGIASSLGKVYVSLAHTDDDLAATVRAYFTALAEVKRDLAG
jgi:hypothetical protein